MANPTFIFIGPDKVGSSWMFELFLEHPQCFVPIAKDIYFFDRYYNRGWDWYINHFSKAPLDAVAIGELSHDYLFSPLAAQRIAKQLPNVRLFTCLRNPVERTFSQYLNMRRSGEVVVDFRTAIEQHPKLIHNSRYASHLRPFLNLFPRDQLKILFFDDLVANSRHFAAEIFEYIGLSFIEDLPFDAKVRPAGKPRWRVVARAAKYGAEKFRYFGYSNLVGRIKRHSDLFLHRPFSRAEKPTIPENVHRELQIRFRPEIEMIMEISGRDLSSWLPA